VAGSVGCLLVRSSHALSVASARCEAAVVVAAVVGLIEADAVGAAGYASVDDSRNSAKNPPLSLCSIYRKYKQTQSD
jgi:hypothetical protein